ncbi:MAG: hypothetical protein LBK45_00485, partial [Tannerellaceae bacterium]|nr:hypothetical protein [Tannerellaceae bacterium]
MKRFYLYIAIIPLFFLAACENDDDDNGKIPDEVELDEEYYAGGKMGTVFVSSSKAYKQAMPAIDQDAQLFQQFMRGERLADKSFVTNEGMGYSGLGPVYIRKSC